ncbi:MAG: hypothetical protein WBF58_21570 [Xanthobacteraceae bacterium]|jgi:hypothetical protein
METSNHDGGIDRRVLSNIRFNAHRLARGRTIPGMEVEDYEQDLLADLLHRSGSFNPNRASFITFADRVVAHRSSSLATPTLRLKAEREAGSLDAPINDDEGNEQTLLDHLPDSALDSAESAAIRFDVDRFVQSLSPLLVETCRLLLDESISAGARAAGIHRSTAYERVARLREQALARGLRIYVADHPDTLTDVPVDDDDRQASSSARRADRQGTIAMGRHGGFSTAHLTLSEIDLCGWLGQAKAGEMLEYYRGFLLVDVVPQSGRLQEQARAELNRVARRALWAAERSMAYLVQRRHGPDDYSYLLIARPRPSAAESFSELFAAEV